MQAIGDKGGKRNRKTESAFGGGIERIAYTHRVTQSANICKIIE